MNNERHGGGNKIWEFGNNNNNLEREEAALLSFIPIVDEQREVGQFHERTTHLQFSKV